MIVDLDEEGLIETVKKVVKKLRLSISDRDCHQVAREVYAELSPQRDEFKRGDQIVWLHQYNHREYPPPKGEVLHWNETQTRVRIRYKNINLFDNAAGAWVEVWVYPRELRHLDEYAAPETEEVASERQGEGARGSDAGAEGPADRDGRVGEEPRGEVPGAGGSDGEASDPGGAEGLGGQV